MDPQTSGSNYFVSDYYYIYSDGMAPNKSTKGEYNYGNNDTHAPYYLIDKVSDRYLDGTVFQGFSKQVVYCVNNTRQAPETSVGPFQPGTETPKYNFDVFVRNPSNNLWIKSKDQASNADINNVTTNNDEKTGYYIKRAIYNGYPYNAKGLQEKYQLTDMQFRAVTQAAVWYYGTTNATLVYNWKATFEKYSENTANKYFTAWTDTTNGLNERMKAAYFTLTQSKKTAGDENYPIKGEENKLIDPPSDVTYSLYEHAGNTYSQYQRLLAINARSGYRITVKKSWADGGNHQPVTVTLKTKGKAYKQATLSADNNWTYTFTNLVEYNTLFQKNTYTIEESVPAGYTNAITGTQDTGFVITNTPTNPNPTIEISKVAATGEGELSGAKLELKDESGQTIDSWTSGNTTHAVQVAPGTYTFHEVAAPSGYTVVSDFTFKVDDKGNISEVSATSNVVTAGAKLTVTDNAAPTEDNPPTTPPTTPPATPPSTKQDKPKNALPKTGDMGLGLAAGAIVAAGIGALVLRKRLS